MMSENKIVEVIWLDAMSTNDHLPLSVAESITPMERRSVGYLIKSDEDCVIITYGFITDFLEGKTACDQALVIPKGMIIKVEELND